jgi:ABC-type transport system substrate-binding protein
MIRNTRMTLLLFLLLAGAGGGIAAAEQGTAGAPQRGGTLHLSTPSDLRSLDPAIAYDNTSVPLCKLLFRGLLDYDEGVNLVPDQAQDWSLSPDARTYTFHLRPGVRFANGRPVEAADYVFSFERILDPKVASPGQTFFMGIQGAAEFVAGKAPHVSGLRAPDAQTFVVELTQPQFTFRYVLAMNFADVVPRDVVQRYGADFQYHLIGSGPYQLTEWRRGIRWRFARNPHYSGTDGYVDGLDLMVGADDTTATMMLERGEIDRTLASPAEAIRFKRDPRLRSWLRLVDTANVDYIFMNTEMKPFDDVRVRRAVNHAINKERLVKLTGGFNSVAQGIVPTSLGWTNSRLTTYDYDPAKARALLREAGFPNGFKTELWYMIDLPVIARLAAGAQQDLQQVGIDAELKPANGTTFLIKASARHQIAFGVWGWFADYPDPSNFLDVLFNGERITDTDCNNVAFYNNPAVNRLLDAASGDMNVAARTEQLREAESRILAGAPWVPLVNERVPVLVNPRIKGRLVHPVWMWRYEKVWPEP